jgi:hypothetical protein
LERRSLPREPALAHRLSINVIKHLEETVSGFLSGSFEIEQVQMKELAEASHFAAAFVFLLRMPI